MEDYLTSTATKKDKSLGKTSNDLETVFPTDF